MGKNKEHKVGYIINVTLEIKEQENINDGCKGCFFDYYGLKCNRPLHYEPFVLVWNVQTVNRLYSLKNNNAKK